MVGYGESWANGSPIKTSLKKDKRHDCSYEGGALKVRWVMFQSSDEVCPPPLTQAGSWMCPVGVHEIPVPTSCPTNPSSLAISAVRLMLMSCPTLCHYACVLRRGPNATCPCPPSRARSTGDGERTAPSARGGAAQGSLELLISAGSRPPNTLSVSVSGRLNKVVVARGREPTHREE